MQVDLDLRQRQERGMCGDNTHMITTTRHHLHDSSQRSAALLNPLQRRDGWCGRDELHSLSRCCGRKPDLFAERGYRCCALARSPPTSPTTSSSACCATDALPSAAPTFTTVTPTSAAVLARTVRVLLLLMLVRGGSSRGNPRGAQ